MPTLRVSIERGPDADLVLLERALTEALVAASGHAATLLISDAKTGAKVDTGVWKASIDRVSTIFTNTTVTRDIGSKLDRGVFAHDDTRPHWPPPGALLGWVRRHGMPDSAEFLVRRKIARRGTKGDYAITAAFDRDLDMMFDAFERALTEALR